MLQKKISKPQQHHTKRQLSIQFSLDGFSFCISNAENCIVHFSSYTFDNEGTTPESLLGLIEEVFKNDEDLHDDFESVMVIHQNHLSSLVPIVYFDEKQLKSYLHYTIKTISTDFIAFDDLDIMDAKNVYIPYINVNNFFFQHFGSFEYKHHTTVLIDKFLKHSKKVHTCFYVNVSKHGLDIVFIDNEKLILSNSFEFYSKEDFIYHILFTFEQLKLDPNESPVYFTGNIYKASDLYKIAYKYIRNIEFLSSSQVFFDGEELEKHSNFILLG